MNAIQPDPLLSELRYTNLRAAWSLVTTHARLRRLVQEDSGVLGPLWFWADPAVDGTLHIVANVLRIIFALLTAPAWMWLPPTTRDTIRKIFQDYFWSREWSQAPGALLAPDASDDGFSGKGGKSGEYAVAADVREPRWLLEVQFRGTEMVGKRQVRYNDESVKRRVRDAGYTAIGYSTKSAEQLLTESGARLDVVPGQYNIASRSKIAGAVLDEYAKARTTTVPKGKKIDGIEYLWLDGLCVSDEDLKNEAQALSQRDTEMGRWADIFRSARRVVVFCHVLNCDHTKVNECPWATRLFALAEVRHATRVLKMTRTHYESSPDEGRGTSVISSDMTVISGDEFRAELQSRAAEAKLWHLHNVMQPSTTSSKTSQSAIHSLILEALRRIEELDASVTHDHLAKALNGLLPRRANVEDFPGVNGWADLMWLLELNQGFYNVALLASVCKLAEAEALSEYRWCRGKSVVPKEGLERLEPLSTGIPVKFHDRLTNSNVPVLSLVNTATIHLEDMLQRDSGALERQEEMKCLRFWARIAWIAIVVLGFILGTAIGGAGAIFLYIASILYVMLQLVVGTIYVTKDRWVIIEDYSTSGTSPFGFLQARDPSFTFGGMEWSSAKQMVPRWEDGVRHMMEPRTSKDAVHPYPVTLIDLGTGVIVKALVTGKPNDMAALAIHGNGISCMLLDRDRSERIASIGVKVGMANLPPYVLAQALPVGNLYVGGHAFRVARPPVSGLTWFTMMLKGQDPETARRTVHGVSGTGRMPMGSAKNVDDLKMQAQAIPLAQTASINSTAPILAKRGFPYRADTSSSSVTATSDEDMNKNGSDLGDGPVPPPLQNSRYRERPNMQWFPERRGADNV